MSEQMTSQPAVDGAKGHERFLFVACFVALVATSFAFIIRVMCMEQWQIDFGLSETQKGEIFGAGLWPFGISIVLFSLAIDRVGYGKSMIFALACHVVSALLMATAAGYWQLYWGSILNGLAAGTVEAIINPAVASLYPKKKTKMLTILHAGWPGGFVLGGIVLLILNAIGVQWRVNVVIILVPTLVYGAMLLKAKFPVSERVVAGVPYKDMLKEAGALGWLIVIYMIGMEVNRVAGWGEILNTSFFDLPSLGMTIAIAVLTVGYLAYTKSLGRPMYVFLLLIMILLAITELGTDTWIKDLMKPAMEDLGLNAGWVLVYTATIMMVLRFCIGPIEKVLHPLGVLFLSSLFAAAGLYFLSGSQGYWILITATIYGAGQCFFWPVTLGLVSERFPRGGALTLNAIAGVGMLGVGILGSQLLGFWQDTRIDEKLRPSPAIYGKLMDPKEKHSIFGNYKSLNNDEVTRVDDMAALHKRRRTVVKEAPAEVDAKLSEDDKYRKLVRQAFLHLTPAKPGALGQDASAEEKKEYAEKLAKYEKDKPVHDAAMDSFDKQLAFLKERDLLLGGAEVAVVKDLEETKDKLDEVRTDAKRNAMATVAILPLIMAACYLGLILYFRATGGYKPIDLLGESGGE